MGISQLLPFLDKITTQCYISEFRGQTVAVDTYCWLHRGARSCSMKLIRGEKTDGFVTYCLKFVKLLLDHDIKPIMVFDGCHLPAKLGTEAKRREQKVLARKQGMECLRLGQVTEAHKFFSQCIDITPEMALDLIKECRKMKVDCIVAPYESDAQLAYLNLNNFADFVISEDSDLLLFGCKKVLYKLDLSGNGQLIEADKLHVPMKIRPEQYSLEKFRHMCILSGCDYIDSLPGIGLKKALKFITMTAETDPAIFIDKVPRYLNLKNVNIPADYKEKFLIADATFRHQTVYDPRCRTLVPLTPIEGNPEYCRNCGDYMDQKIAFELSVGNLNPLTMEQLDDWYPSDTNVNKYSIWSSCYSRRPKSSEVKSTNSPASKPIDTKVINQLNAQYDQKVEEELRFYILPEESPKKSLEESPPKKVPEKKDNAVSPIIGNNPFVRKKISRFQMTKTLSSQKVISRFFSQNVIGSYQERMKSLQSTSSSSQESPDYSDIENGNYSELDNGVSSVIDDTSGSDNPGSPAGDVVPVECECILEEGEESVLLETLDEAATLAQPCVTSIPAPGEVRKRKLPEDPQPKKVKKQMTIQNMFKRMNMK